MSQPLRPDMLRRIGVAHGQADNVIGKLAAGAIVAALRAAECGDLADRIERAVATPGPDTALVLLVPVSGWALELLWNGDVVHAEPQMRMRAEVGELGLELFLKPGITRAG